jgi:hypothetical protein
MASHTLPYLFVRSLFFLFRHHYVGQLSRVYLVDPPLVVRVVWFLMHYLVGHRYARHIQCIDAERYHAMVIESDIESQLQCAVARTSSSPTNHALPWSRRDSISSATTSTTRLNCSTCVDDDGLENSSTTSSSSDTLVMSPLAEDGSSEFASRISKAVTMQEQQQRVIPLMVHTLQREQPLFVSERVEV